MENFRSLNIGFNYFVKINSVIAVVSPDSVPIKRLIQSARKSENLVDATRGRRTRAVVISDDNTFYLSCIQPETLAERLSPTAIPTRLKKMSSARLLAH